MTGEIRWEDYNAFRDTGFLIDLDEDLPLYFRPWHELASKAYNLVKAGTMRQALNGFPQLDSTRLESYKQLRLAHGQLTVIFNMYVFGEENTPVTSVPACVGVPYCDVSDRLGIPVGMTYAALTTLWRRIDNKGPYTEENLEVTYLLPGGQEFIDFIRKAAYTEIVFAKAIPAIEDVLYGTRRRNAEQVRKGFNLLHRIVNEIFLISKRYHNILTPEVFFNVISVGLRGLNEKHGYPGGILFEGVTDRPRRYGRDSAASQTLIFQLCDCLLGIEYSKDKQDFFSELRDTWPRCHRELFKEIKDLSTNIKEFVESSGSTELQFAHKQCQKEVESFRTYHLQLVTKYVIIPAKNKRKANNTEEGHDQLVGLVHLLKSIRDETKVNKPT